ncbi:MAG: xanthine dehydrogenase family protein subunit M [Chloroflexota bacterium]|nr:xanthine dehydrogenase family protein subunit M [Chloroflexota bacterium]
MHPFSYQRVTTVEEAIACVTSDRTATFLAGGTNLIDLMKLGVTSPEHLIDISHLPLGGVEEHDGGLRIGALTRNSDLAQHPLMRERYPLVVEALYAGASPQLRNMATVGGNLLQRTRCAYFTESTMACNKRLPSSGCPAIAGENRMHAILGTSAHCIAAHPSDLCIALIALDALIQLQGPHGTRSVPLADFYLLPGETPECETILQHGELIVAVDLPTLPPSLRSHYLKVRDRTSYAFALVSVGAALDIVDGVIRSARLACGGVATRPWRLFASEELLLGAKVERAAFVRAADVAVQEAVPREHNAFKIDLLKRTVIRTLSVVEGML